MFATQNFPRDAWRTEMIVPAGTADANGISGGMCKSPLCGEGGRSLLMLVGFLCRERNEPAFQNRIVFCPASPPITGRRSSIGTRASPSGRVSGKEVLQSLSDRFVKPLLGSQLNFLAKSL